MQRILRHAPARAGREERGLNAELLRLILDRYRLDLHGIHGIAHWARVLENGRRLAAVTGADGAVIEFFALFHDSCRNGDGQDPGHGPRAAELVESLRGRIGLDDARLSHLVEACRCHTFGAAGSAHITVLTCLDSDRLDIPRVGIQIKPWLLSTEAARAPDIIAWATERAERRAFPALLAEEWGWKG